MRKLILRMSMSLDGFVSGPNGESDWIFRTGGEDARAWVLDAVRQAGLHAMGSRTFRDMAGYWPTSDLPFAAPMNETPKVVFTQRSLDLPAATAPHGSWTNPIVADGELCEEIARLKAQPGDYILAHGGAGFAQSLAANGLIDEYRLLVHPVALGRGLPIFSALPAPIDLKLVSSEAFKGGAMGMVYHPA